MRKLSSKRELRYCTWCREQCRKRGRECAGMNHDAQSRRLMHDGGWRVQTGSGDVGSSQGRKNGRDTKSGQLGTSVGLGLILHT